jgi:hypothetical protein
MTMSNTVPQPSADRMAVYGEILSAERWLDAQRDFLRLLRQLGMSPHTLAQIADDDARLERMMGTLSGDITSIDQLRANAVAKDGPIAPKYFGWDGKRATLSPLQFRLLQAVWIAPDRSLEIESAIEAVWGHDHGGASGLRSENNLDRHISAANNRLSEAVIPVSLHRKNGCICAEVSD